MSRPLQTITLLLVLLTTFVAPRHAGAQQTRVVVDEFAVSKFVTDVKSTLRLPSVAAGIVGPEKVHYLEAYGPAELDQRFRLGSLSKTFTALAAHLLAHDGMLALDDAVAEWFPEAPKDVTLRHLLNHTSGLSTSDGHAPTVKPNQTVGSWITHATWSPPGEYEYSNLNYVILGAILEKVSKKSYPDLLKARVFAPLKLDSARASATPRSSVQGHQYVFGFPMKRPAPSLHPAEIPAGGVAASPEDVSRFLRTMLNKGKLDGEQVLPAEVVNDVVAPANGLRYADGWGRTTIGGVDVAAHSGLTATFASFHAVAPQREVGVFALTNVNSYNARAATALGKGLLRTMLGAPQEAVSNLEFVGRLGLGIVLLLCVVAFLIEFIRWFGYGRPLRMNSRRIIYFAVITVVLSGLVIGVSRMTGSPIDMMFRYQPDLAAGLVGIPAALALRQLFKGFTASYRERQLE